MDGELRFDVDAYADDLQRSGIPKQEALRRAGMWIRSWRFGTNEKPVDLTLTRA
jgi:hypothetical protein